MVCLFVFDNVLIIFFCHRVAFSSFGAYWLAYATISIPGSGIGDAYKSDPDMEQHALGIFHLAWTFLTFLFLCVFNNPCA